MSEKEDVKLLNGDKGNKALSLKYKVRIWFEVVEFLDVDTDIIKNKN